MMCALSERPKIPFCVIICFILSCACNIVIEGKQNENYTPEEFSKLKKLGEFSTNILDSEYMRNDGYLARWLKANDWDLLKAQKHLGTVMAWRKENNYAHILDEIPIPEFVKNPFYTILHAKDGQPAFLLATKYFNVRKYVVRHQIPQLIRAVRQSYEKVEITIHNARNLTGQNISQAVCIFNLQEYNPRQHGCLGCTPMYLEMTSGYEHNHPYLFSKIILANAPRAFNHVFQLIKPLLSKATRDDTTMYGFDDAEMKPKLRALILPDQLPRSLGGTRHIK